MSDFFVGTICDVLNMYNGDIYFLICSKCLFKLTNVFNISGKCYSKNHDECISKLLTYLYERADEEIAGKYLFQFWDLCKNCKFQICHDLKGEFSAVFHVSLLRHIAYRQT